MAQQDAGRNALPLRYGTGGAAGARGTSHGRMSRGEGVTPCLPPLEQAVVKALAGAWVSHPPQPLRRQSLADVPGRAPQACGQPSSRRTVGRMVAAEALKPWPDQDWMFPRAPLCAETAGRGLALHAGLWEGQPLGPQDPRIRAEEQTRIQARLRCHPSLPPAPGRAASSACEDERGGALPDLAGWAVRRGDVRGRCAPPPGIAPFGRRVDPVMHQEPSRAGQRICGGVDHGSSHRGHAACQRLTLASPTLLLVPTPVHASGLNQGEISTLHRITW
jgi:hypothetical protein